MKILIAYASKTGVTSKAAKLLAERFSDVTLRDLTVGSPNPDDYDAVILGGSIRRGVLHKDARKWLEEYGEVLGESKSIVSVKGIIHCYQVHSKLSD